MPTVLSSSRCGVEYLFRDVARPRRAMRPSAGRNRHWFANHPRQVRTWPIAATSAFSTLPASAPGSHSASGMALRRQKRRWSGEQVGSLTSYLTRPRHSMSPIPKQDVPPPTQTWTGDLRCPSRPCACQPVQATGCAAAIVTAAAAAAVAAEAVVSTTPPPQLLLPASSLPPLRRPRRCRRRAAACWPSGRRRRGRRRPKKVSRRPGAAERLVRGGCTRCFPRATPRLRRPWPPQRRRVSWPHGCKRYGPECGRRGPMRASRTCAAPAAAAA